MLNAESSLLFGVFGRNFFTVWVFGAEPKLLLCVFGAAFFPPSIPPVSPMTSVLPLFRIFVVEFL
ncbi:MAG: hypothetical protein FWD86_00205 [Firmicutes bacterium]|nr:hypothetical protein [Bacillota bacterium]